MVAGWSLGPTHSFHLLKSHRENRPWVWYFSARWGLYGQPKPDRRGSGNLPSGM